MRFAIWIAIVVATVCGAMLALLVPPPANGGQVSLVLVLVTGLIAALGSGALRRAEHARVVAGGLIAIAAGLAIIIPSLAGRSTANPSLRLWRGTDLAGAAR